MKQSNHSSHHKENNFAEKSISFLKKYKKRIFLVAMIIILVIVAIRIIKSEEDEQLKNSESVEFEENQNTRSYMTNIENGKIKIPLEDISENALYVDCPLLSGKVVELVAVKAPDNTVRIGVNACEECKGNTKGHFIQGDGIFQCMNCGHICANGEVGTESTGCAPLPVTYQEEDGNIVVDFEDLNQYESYF